MNDKLNISDKAIQSMGLKLVEAAPKANTVMLWVSGDRVYLKASFEDGTSRDADVPLLKEVDG